MKNSRIELIVVLVGIRNVVGVRLTVGPLISAIFILKHEPLGIRGGECEKRVLDFAERSQSRVGDLDGGLPADSGDTGRFTVDVRPVPVSIA